MDSLQLTERARKDLENLPRKAQEEVVETLSEFEKEQFNHPELKAIRDGGEWIWRLKIKRDHTDHCAFIDYNNQQFTVLSIQHRDTAYE